MAVILAVVGAFVLRLVERYEEEGSACEEVMPDGKVCAAWQFPPKESRDERRKRWARALRKRLWPGAAADGAAARPNAGAQVTKAAVEDFIAVLAAAQRGDPAPVVAGWEYTDDGFEVAFVRPVPPVLTTPEKERLRRHILSIAMNAGPPKRLQPITEESRAATSRGGSVDEETGTFGATPPTSAPTPPSISPQRSFLAAVVAFVNGTGDSPKYSGSSQWLEEDSETVLLVGGVAASRSLLWAALRELR